MSAGRHTPGPWRVGKNLCVVLADDPCSEDFPLYGGAVVASCSVPADARLAAAALDLLAACEEAAECLVRNARVVDAGSVATVARLGQAIALARGGK